MNISKILFLSMMLLLSACTTRSVKDKRALLFIHGSNFNASSWSLVINALKEFESYSINLPGRNDNIPHKEIGLDYSAKALCKTLLSLKRDLVIVAHSQAGAIINQSLSVCPTSRIEKIIYIASVVPLDREKIFGKLSKEDERQYFSGIRYDEKNSSLTLGDKNKFVRSFAGAVNNHERRLILSSAVSEPSPIGEGVVKLNKQKFNAIEKYYIETLQDKIISLGSQRNITSELNLKTIYSIPSGHLPMITHDEELSSLIRKILMANP